MVIEEANAGLGFLFPDLRHIEAVVALAKTHFS
jgi:hypothetical protein